jgi:diaminopimelate epimerase
VSLIKFSKMHGAGNDFVVIDAISQQIDMTPELARGFADRHRGVGCDQLLLVEAAPNADTDFRYRIFNADGGEVEQCGNGARCFVRFVHDRGLTIRREIRVLTRSGVIVPRLESDGSITVNMGPPILALDRVPFNAAGLAAGGDASTGIRQWPLEVNGRVLEIAALSMGNPHAVQWVGDVDAAPVERDGPVIEGHPRFPRHVNVGFMQFMNRGHIRLRVYERGAGETLACGTGACAAAVTGILQGRLDSPVAVDTRGGRLTIAWAGADNPVFMTGPAVTVFEGSIDSSTLVPRNS